ncbi:hypothetical protein [Novosphingobium sp.]|uniref:hypothetical protein n=1 Tax=Novosphingobium sp. TaxID=1874826 RepID=UPI00286E61BC|nr:hypothetical protein [Novosphingobium sp.]
MSELMAHLKKAQTAVLATVCSMTVTACATGPQLPAQVNSLESDPFSIEWVHAYVGKNGISVTGTVRRSHGRYGIISGDLEVAAHLEDGSVVTSKLVRWGTFPHRGSRRASFNAQLPVAASSVVRSVSVRYIKSKSI